MIRAVKSSQTKAEGKARVLESEIKMDKGRTGNAEIIIDSDFRIPYNKTQ